MARQAPREVSFQAYFPDTKNALRMNGQGNGGGIVLEIPEECIDAIVALKDARENVLDVTIRWGSGVTTIGRGYE